MQPEADAAEARARRDEPEVKVLAQALEDAVSRCAADPEGEALEEKPVLKAVRLFCHYLTGEHGPDEVRAGFRRSLYRLAHAREREPGGISPRVPFDFADGLTRLWIDLYPALPELREGDTGAPRAPHIYLDAERATVKARARWNRVAPRPGRCAVLDLRDARVEDARTIEKRVRPSKRYDAGEAW